MTATAPRTANGTPDLRRVAVAVGALTLAVVLLVAVAFVRPAGGPSATTSSPTKGLSVHGTGGYTGIPYTPTRPAPKALPSLHGSPSGATSDDMSSAIRSDSSRSPRRPARPTSTRAPPSSRPSRTPPPE